MAMDGIFVDGIKQYFKPEDILESDASSYTEQIAVSVNEWLEENVTGGSQVTDTTLSLSGVPADAKVTGDTISELSDDIDAELTSLKEDLSTLNTEGTVPTSEQMLSDNYTEDSVPYHFRKTASDNADREELEIVGGSVAWNQLVSSNSIPSASSTVNGITRTSNGDGSVTLNGTSTASTSIALTGGINAAEGHVYYLGNPNGFKLYDGYGTHGQIIVKLPTGTSTLQIYTNIASGVTLTDYKLYPQAIDLTAMFGSTIADHIYSLEQATAGAGVALFRSLFPKDYYAYDAGSIQSVSGLSEHKTVGFNAWDEEWELGGIDASTGLNTEGSSSIRCKNYIPVTPSTLYYVSGLTSGNCRPIYYDADKEFISAGYWMGGTSNNPQRTPSNARYMRFYLATTYGTTYNHDICINISDPSKNGTYEPYDGHSYPLNPNGDLRGIPTLVDGKIKWDGDVYSPSGKVTRRYGIVDLGTLNWEYSTASTTLGAYFYAYKSGIKSQGAPYNNAINAICTNYSVVKRVASDFVDKTLCGDGTDTTIIQIQIKDSAYNDAAAFKAAMSGVYLVYELATPTTEQADPYVSPQICHYDGTEEFVSTGIVPVGHNTKYPDNMRAKLDGLPWNFASLIAPTESGFKATRNYTTGALLIVNNVLYKATANIANGGTITPNTNVTATTLADVIAALS